jgi:hypothetical protein
MTVAAGSCPDVKRGYPNQRSSCKPASATTPVIHTAVSIKPITRIATHIKSELVLCGSCSFSSRLGRSLRDIWSYAAVAGRLRTAGLREGQHDKTRLAARMQFAACCPGQPLSQMTCRKVWIEMEHKHPDRPDRRTFSLRATLPCWSCPVLR